MSNLAAAVKAELIRVMAEEGVSQNELSRRTGIHQTSISSLLRGDREIQTDTIEKLASHLGMQARIVFEPAEEHAGV